MCSTARWLTTTILFVGVALFGARWEPAYAQCAGDCDDNDEVSISDLVMVVNVAIGEMPQSACVNADSDPGDGEVAISEIIQSVRAALFGCYCSGEEVSFDSTFAAIQKQIFERRGCTSAICHGGPPFQAGLD